MDRDTEIRIYIMGDERELRPLSAESLLQAMKESRTIFEEYGGSAGLIEGACVVARGLFGSDDERVFADGREVLEALTAEEIDMAASEYAGDISLSRDKMPESETDTMNLAFYDTEAALWDGMPKQELETYQKSISETRPYRDMPASEDKSSKQFDMERRYWAKNSERPERRNIIRREGSRRSKLENLAERVYTNDLENRPLRSDELLRQRVGEESPAYVTENVPVRRIKVNTEIMPMRNKTPEMPTGATETQYVYPARQPDSQWRDMEYVSDFFERDSRRYDSSVKLY